MICVKFSHVSVVDCCLGVLLSVLVVLAEMHWEAGWDFPSSELLTHTHRHLQQIDIQHMPDDFISTMWYMAAANADCFQNFHLLSFLPVSERLPSVIHLVSNYRWFPMTKPSAPLEPISLPWALLGTTLHDIHQHQHELPLLLLLLLSDGVISWSLSSLSTAERLWHLNKFLSTQPPALLSASEPNKELHVVTESSDQRQTSGSRIPPPGDQRSRHPRWKTWTHASGGNGVAPSFVLKRHHPLYSFKYQVSGDGFRSY